MEADFKFTALVTGFGPFGKHEVNASWEAVKELKKLCIDSNDLKDVKILIKEIPVSYAHVSDYIPKLWKEYNPTVVLHVGVSRIAECLKIEQYARNNGYYRTDIHDHHPNETIDGTKVLKTDFDVEKICDIVNGNSEKTGCTACTSNDAGRYLCEYTLYQSLCIEPKKTLFVHVPDFDKYSIAQTAKGLYDILCYMLKHLRKDGS